MVITSNRLSRLVLVDLAAFIAGAAAYASDDGHLPFGVVPVTLGVFAAGNLGVGLYCRRRRGRRPRRVRRARSESDGGMLWSAIGWSGVHLLFFALVLGGPFLADSYISHHRANVFVQQLSTPPVANASPAIGIVPSCTSKAITATFAAPTPAATWLTFQLTNASQSACRLGSSETVVAVGGAGSVVAKLTPAQPSNTIGPVLNPGDRAAAWVTAATCPRGGSGAPGFSALRIMWAGGSALVTLPHASFLATAGSDCSLTVSPFEWSSGA